MRALIIEEKEVKNLIDRLELRKMKLNKSMLTEDAIHRMFHYEVVKWFQEQGMDKVY